MEVFATNLFLMNPHRDSDVDSHSVERRFSFFVISKWRIK